MQNFIRTKTFISYSHRDVRYLDRLHVHLAYYKRHGLVDTWDDLKVLPGTVWREEITGAYPPLVRWDVRHAPLMREHSHSVPLETPTGTPFPT